MNDRLDHEPTAWQRFADSYGRTVRRAFMTTVYALTGWTASIAFCAVVGWSEDAATALAWTSFGFIAGKRWR